MASIDAGQIDLAAPWNGMTVLTLPVVARREIHPRLRSRLDSRSATRKHLRCERYRQGAYQGFAFCPDGVSSWHRNTRKPCDSLEKAGEYRAEVMAPGEDFDQTGFELPPAPEAAAEVTGQRLLFDD